MKEVKRYKCDYCGKLAARPETIEHHERECVRNPDGKNCYICEYAVDGGYVDDGYTGEKYVDNIPYCDLHLEPLESLRGQGHTALVCSDFKKSDKMYYHRQGKE